MKCMCYCRVVIEVFCDVFCDVRCIFPPQNNPVQETPVTGSEAVDDEVLLSGVCHGG